MSTKPPPLKVETGMLEQEPRLHGFLGGVEWLGNKLPSPFVLFAGILVVVAATSAIVAAFGVVINVPGMEEPLPVRSALDPAALVELATGVVRAFVTFPALGPALVVVLGIGVAQGTGALESAVRLLFARVPKWFVPYVVALVACQGHVMSDGAFIVIPPLAALVFLAVGRHPLAGLIGAYACIATGYGGGVLLGALDASLAGITQKAAEFLPMGQDFQGNIAMNYYFGAAAGLLLAGAGGFMIDKVLEPKLGVYKPNPEAPHHEAPGIGVTAAQKRAVLIAVAATISFIALLVTAWLIPGSPLQGENGTLIPSPMLDMLPVVICLSFIVFGLVYARMLPASKEQRDVGKHMQNAISEMSGFIVLIFIIAQTLAVLSYSNLGTWMAVGMASGVQNLGLSGFWVLLLLVLISATLNLVITSGSGLWSLESTVMVPAFMILGLSPAITQAAHRIGDSITQGISPMHIFLYVILAMCKGYVPDFKLGTLLARVMPFVPVFALVWIGVLAVFYFGDLPPGPGQTIQMP